MAINHAIFCRWHILERLTKGNSECDLQSLDPSRLLGLLDYVELHIGLGGQPIALPTSLLAEPPDVVSFLKHYVRDVKFKNGERVSYFAIRVAIGRPHQSTVNTGCISTHCNIATLEKNDNGIFCQILVQPLLPLRTQGPREQHFMGSSWETQDDFCDLGLQLLRRPRERQRFPQGCCPTRRSCGLRA